MRTNTKITTMAIAEIERVDPSAELVYIVASGSVLHGTDTPDSDKDYTGIYIASQESILLGNIKKEIKITTGDAESKNSSEDIDIKLIELGTFLTRLAHNEINAIDLAGTLTIDYTIDHHESITFCSNKINQVREFSKLIKLCSNKTITKLMGGAISMVSRSGIKSDNLKEITRIMAIITNKGLLKDKVPEISKTTNASVSVNLENNTLNLFGRSFSLDINLSIFDERYEIANFLGKEQAKYGARTKETAAVGVNRKALSHAIRHALVAVSILEGEEVIYPMAESEFLKGVKSGDVDSKEAREFLDDLIIEINRFPETDAHEEEHAEHIKKIISKARLLSF